MSASSLLLWMSARGAGSWSQFRAAVEELHLKDNDDATGPDAEEIADEAGLPIYHALRLNFQRLGHAEFGTGAGENDWRVTPPCLALTAQPVGWRGVLAGARSRDLLSRVVEHGRVLGVEQVSVAGCPDVVRFAATDAHMMEELAARTGVRLQTNAAEALLMSLPSVDDRSTLRRTPVPFGNEWRIERFSVRSLSWKPALREEVRTSSFGLFRFSLQYRRHTLLCIKGVAFEVPVQVGKYIVLRRRGRRTLRYDEHRREVLVPLSCRPPFLVERALILCSGITPSCRTGNEKIGTLCYGDVPLAVAQLAAAVLKQELR